VVVVIGLVATAGLALGARRVHDNNEERLLDQRVREVGAVLSAAIPTLQSSLGSAGTVAVATNGNTKVFEGVVRPIVAAKSPFDSVGLWRIGPGGPQRIAQFGTAPELASGPSDRVAAVFSRAAKTTKPFVVVDFLDGPRRRLGYASAIPKPGAQYVVYGERSLARTRTARVARDSAFADLDYALFVGKQPQLSKLIASSTGGARLVGRTGSIAVPFGDTHLLLVISPRSELGGSLLSWLPSLLAVFLLLCTVAATATVWRLSKRRNEAESLAFENERLYADQRSVAQTLQHSLLPQTLPEAPGLEFGAVYAPGTEGIDIGGDWYEVVPRPDGTVVVVVGDVSGHGLEAATMMASLRFAIRAYAADGDSPATILNKLTRLVNIGRDGHFATLLCGVVDPIARTTTWADAGHPRPLLVTDGEGRFVSVTVGPPVGVVAGAEYAESRVDLPADGTLLPTPTGSSNGAASRSTSASSGWRTRRAVSVTIRSPMRCSPWSGARSPPVVTTTLRCSASDGTAPTPRTGTRMPRWRSRARRPRSPTRGRTSVRCSTVYRATWWRRWRCSCRSSPRTACGTPARASPSASSARPLGSASRYRMPDRAGPGDGLRIRSSRRAVG
jgi:hypothetical protein